MTIEQKALKAWGSTDYPECAIWILPDGTMIDGCQGSPGRRDVDHAEIGQFFKPSKFQDPGSNYIYIKKFVRRGNIRISMDGNGFYAQFYRAPSAGQIRALQKCARTARRLQKPCGLEKLGTRLYWDSVQGVLDYLSKRPCGLAT